MDIQDLQQISKLFGKKLDDKFKENNKILEQKMDEKIDQLAEITSQSFTALEEKIDKNFNEVKDELAKRPTKKEIFDWADNKTVELELDIKRVKYIHREEWKNLPSMSEISARLVEDNLNN